MTYARQDVLPYGDMPRPKAPAWDGYGAVRAYVNAYARPRVYQVPGAGTWVVLWPSAWTRQAPGAPILRWFFDSHHHAVHYAHEVAMKEKSA